MAGTNPTTIWATLAGVYGPQGAIPFIDSSGYAPTIDVTNFYYDATYKQLMVGFAAIENYPRYGSGGVHGIIAENGIDSYVSVPNQLNGKVAQHSVSSARGTAQVPLYSQPGDLLGKFNARSWNIPNGNTVPSWNDFFQILVYSTGVTLSNLGSTVDFKIKLDNGVLTSFLTVLQDLSATFAGDLVVNGDMVINGSIIIPGLVVNTGNLADYCVTAIKESNDAFSPVASEATVDIAAINSRNILIQGVVSITSFNNSAAVGTRRLLTFDNALIITPGASQIITPGNYPIRTAAGDLIDVISLGAGVGWQVIGVYPASGFNVTASIIPQNSLSADYSIGFTDAGKTLFHPASDANSRTFTIPSNASVAFPLGTVLQFINRSANNITIAITADTLTLGQGSSTAAGTTGSRTLAQYGVATAQKIGTTEWLITGVGLT